MINAIRDLQAQLYGKGNHTDYLAGQIYLIERIIISLGDRFDTVENRELINFCQLEILRIASEFEDWKGSKPTINFTGAKL